MSQKSRSFLYLLSALALVFFVVLGASDRHRQLANAPTAQHHLDLPEPPAQSPPQVSSPHLFSGDTADSAVRDLRTLDTAVAEADAKVPAEPLEERKTPVDAENRLRRHRIIKGEGKYAFTRVEETWRTDPATGTEALESRVSMVADHILVKVNDHASEETLTTFVGQLGGKIRRRLPNSAVYLIEVPQVKLAVFDLFLEQFRQNGAPVAHAEPDYMVNAHAVPNDTRFGDMWGMNNTGQQLGITDADIDAPEAWSRSTGSSSIVVGVIDTGIDQDHPDLVPNLWTNPHEIPGNGIDDDGNGYVDDVRGWDFVNDDNNPDDDNYHGTSCAGTIGARGNNNLGVAGVNWNVRMVSLKFLNATGSGWASDAVEAVMYATSIGVHVTSNSWGGTSTSTVLEDAIAEAGQAGILFVASAGNDNAGTASFPAGFDLDNIISVAASTRHDLKASFSNFNAESVDLAAPGESILSTVVGGGYGSMSGTSAAAPHVAGACALLLASRPDLQASEVKSILLSTIDTLPDFVERTVSGGRLNLDKLLQAAQGFYVTPYSALKALGPAGGPFSASAIYTLINKSDEALSWSAVKTQPWISLSSTGGTIPPGGSVPVMLSINAAANSLPTGVYEDTVIFSGLTSPALTFSRSVSLTVKAAFPAMHLGWPVGTSTHGWATTVADIDQNGTLEVFSSGGSNLQPYRHDGTFIQGWPGYTNGSIVGPPSIGDLDGDGIPEICVISNSSGIATGNLHMWSPGGTAITGWPKSFLSGSSYPSRTISPCIADLDRNGKSEVVYTSSSAASGGNTVVNVANKDGSSMTGWPVTVSGSGGPTLASPAAADFDGDGKLDIAVVTSGGKLFVYRHDGTLLSGFPVTLGSTGNWNSSVTFADLFHDGTLDLIVTVQSGLVAAYNSAGQVLSGWPKNLASAPSPPAIADLDQDGFPEILIGTQDGMLRVLDRNGNARAGWPKAQTSRVYTPAVADLDNDGSPEIVAVEANCKLSAWNADGSIRYDLGFPVQLSATSGGGPPLIADVDANGTLEIICYSNKVEVRDLSTRYNPQASPWPMMFRDTLSNGRYAPPPKFSAITPNQINPNSVGPAVISGDFFLRGMKVIIGGVPQTVVSETVNTITINVAGLSTTGFKDVVISNANSGSTTGSAIFAVGSPLMLTVPKDATEGNGTLDKLGKLRLVIPAVQDAVITLASSDTSEVLVPASIMIPAGQTDVDFNIMVADDAIVDGPQSVVITASASGHPSATSPVIIHDNERPALTVSTPGNVTESAGVVTGTISINMVPASNITIALRSSNLAELTVPATVVLAAGQSSVSFPITIVDDNRIDGTQPVMIFAEIANWFTASSTLNIADNEVKQLTLYLPWGLGEGTGIHGNVKISGTLPTDLIVTLSMPEPRLSIPPFLTIPAGRTLVEYTGSAIDNQVFEGTKTATVTASAPGFISHTQSTPVSDNEAHHLTISTISSPQIKGLPFSIEVTAENATGTKEYSYNGNPVLTAEGTNGLIPVTPASLGPGVNGSGTWNVAVGATDANVRLTVRDWAGATGTSNTFSVNIGPVTRFAWEPAPGPQKAGVPFPVTIMAKDAGNNTVTTFTGQAGIKAFKGAAATSGIVISEVHEHDPTYNDAIEFTNVSGSPINISGWRITVYSAFSTPRWPLPSTTYTVPNGTVCAANQVFVLRGNAAGPGTFPNLNAGVNSFNFLGSNLAMAVLLRDPAGNTVDFVMGGTATLSELSLPAPISQNQWKTASLSTIPYEPNSRQRMGSSDTNGNTDWFVGPNSIGTLNSGLSMTFSGGTQTFDLAPSSTGTFINGTWTGNVTVSQAVSGLKLNVDNGSGFVGESNEFDVATAPLLQVTQAETLASTGPEGGPFSPSSATYRLSNTGTGPMAWAASKNATWLTLTPAAGTIPVGGSVDVTASVNGNATTLSAAQHSDTVAFANTSNGIGNATRPASLLIGLSAYKQWLQAHGVALDTPHNASLANDGIPNLLKAALGINPRVSGYQGRMRSTKIEVGGKSYLAVEFTAPTPAPLGLSYQAETADGLTGWRSEDTTVVSSTVTNGLRTMVVRDTKPIEDNNRRFIRLRILSGK